MNAASCSRRGFTLIEVMIGLVLVGMVSAVIYQTLVATQRVTDAQAERADLQSSLRAGALIVPNELRQLTVGPSASLDSVSDIRAIDDTSITYRAMRGFYTLCATPADARTIVVVKAEPSPFAADYRSPSTSDNAMVFWEGDTLSSTDDRWIPVPISGFSTGTCTYPSGPPDKASYTLLLGATGIPGAYPVTKMYAGAPVRTYETVLLSLYSSGGREWLGMGVNGASIQPVLGPLAPTSGGVYGFQLTYYDSTGAVLTASSASIPRVRSIRVALRGVTHDPIALSGTVRAVIQDSLITVVTPRNTPAN